MADSLSTPHVHLAMPHPPGRYVLVHAYFYLFIFVSLFFNLFKNFLIVFFLRFSNKAFITYLVCFYYYFRCVQFLTIINKAIIINTFR